MNYGLKMKEIREKNNLSQVKAAEILGISDRTYGHYETQYQIIPINHLVTFCNYFNTSLDYIFEFTNIKNYDNFNNDLSNKIAGERLKIFRKNNKLTQVKLAVTLNTTQAVIANYERGRNLIATPFLYDLCKKYKISADYLLGRTNEPIKYTN